MSADTFLHDYPGDVISLLGRQDLPFPLVYKFGVGREATVSALDGLVLESAGIQRGDGGSTFIIILAVGRLPQCSLANDFAFGELPEEFVDLTLAEEMLCSINRMKVYVMKIKSIGSPEMAQRGYKGNCIAFPQRIPDVEKILPRSVLKLPEFIKMVFVGSVRPPKDALRKTLKVRRSKFVAFLLRRHNLLYKDIEISTERLAEVADDAVGGETLPHCVWKSVTLAPETAAEKVERVCIPFQRCQRSNFSYIFLSCTAIHGYVIHIVFHPRYSV